MGSAESFCLQQKFVVEAVLCLKIRLNTGSGRQVLFRFLSIGEERNYDFWLGSSAKFLLSKNSDKIRLTELAKNQTFPLFMRILRLILGRPTPVQSHHAATIWNHEGEELLNGKDLNIFNKTTQLACSSHCVGRQFSPICDNMAVGFLIRDNMNLET